MAFFFFYGLNNVEAQIPYRSSLEKKRNKEAKELKKTRTYYNLKGDKISRKKFYNQTRENRYLYRINDSLSELRLVKGWGERGEIDYQNFIRTLNEDLNLQLDDSKSLIVKFYAGVDGCSLTGTARIDLKRHWYKSLERKANKITATNFLYVYKTTKGLITKDVLDWHKDPNKIMEKNFFKHHYPCGSHVILSPKNKFISLFGEMGKGGILKVLKKLK